MNESCEYRYHDQSDWLNRIQLQAKGWYRPILLCLPLWGQNAQHGYVGR